MKKYDVIIIGAGAAGLYCAYQVASSKLSVLLIEKNKDVGKKILISGGGKCNFTNIFADHQNYISKNNHFCHSALNQYSPWQFIEHLNEEKIPYIEREKGKYFCKNSAKDIVKMLTAKCINAGVKIKTSQELQTIEKHNDGFHLKTNSDTYSCSKVVVATGGLSVPSLGANDIGYRIGKQFGHKLIKTDPALVPFKLKDNPFSSLSGISLEVVIKNDHISFKDKLLFTHRGLSGPAILQISNYWYHDKVFIDFIPDMDTEELVSLLEKSSNQKLSNVLSHHLPKNMVDFFIHLFSFSDIFINQLGQKQTKEIVKAFKNWTLSPDQTEGYRKAEVTRGGLDTANISSKTMQSKLCEGLYFIGEVLDITGWLGGYNFQWAWASAVACANHIKSLK